MVIWYLGRSIPGPKIRFPCSANHQNRGRDDSQKDILYRQYLKKGDVFVHANLDGAIPVIIKNKLGAPSSPIPPGTLSQAGTLSVATSVAWDSKAVIAAWWVKAEQVSKFAPTGDYLPPGNFFVRGDKNFLPPTPLVLGFAVLFQISEDSLANHTKHRVQEDEGMSEQTRNLVEAASAVSLSENGGNDKPQQDVIDDDVESGASSEDELEEPEEPTNHPQPSDAIQDTQAKYDDNSEEDESEEEVYNEELGENISRQTTNEQEQSGKMQDKDEPSASAARSPTPSHSKKSSAPQTRGKKGKKKKLKTKYAHQDEDDRELALRLLGSGTKPDKAAEAARAKKEREAEAEAQKERRRAQHNRAAEEERQRQLEFAKLEDQGLEGPNSRAQDLTEAEIADIQSIPCLVGKPVSGDEILAAVPICAPWTALATCKFRTKLQPGTTKKGKAVREMLGRWISDATTVTSRSKGVRKPASSSEHTGTGATGEDDGQEGKDENIEARELDLIKGWRDVEVINTVPVGRVRVVVSGGAGDAKGRGNKKGGKGARGSKKKKKGP